MVQWRWTILRLITLLSLLVRHMNDRPRDCWRSSASEQTVGITFFALGNSLHFCDFLQFYSCLIAEPIMNKIFSKKLTLIVVFK